MQMAATTRRATLKGHAAIPLSVSGVTTAPSRIPTSTKQRRASDAGIFTGRPASAAIATVNIEPATSPPGKPTKEKLTPPTAAMSSVSAVCTISRCEGKNEDGIDRSRTLDRSTVRPAVRYCP